MKKLITIFAFLLPTMVFASSGIHLESAHNDIMDNDSLKRGANLFIDYCSGCHSTKYSRFQRVADDLKLTDDELAGLMFTTEKPGNTMGVAMTSEDGEAWFGVTPPDLSVISRARGVDWLYTYLISFYKDPKRPLGVNNLVFKDVGMPHVLWDRQGFQELVHETETDASGHEHEVVKLVSAEKDEAKSEKFKEDVRDLVNFLDYIGEPA
ncbi:MAG: cytochrome c1, partial [Thiomargarita sp.]|nr:cytochrome c1 [Thiomargarita sp.]